MRKSATHIKLEFRNAVIRLNRGVIDIEQFLQEARGRRDACWMAGIFFEWSEVKAFLQEHGLPSDYLEELEDIWIWD